VVAGGRRYRLRRGIGQALLAHGGGVVVEDSLAGWLDFVIGWHTH
jgi:hypothetical protein